MNRTRPKQIVIRATEKEKADIQRKVFSSKKTQNEYLLMCALNKDIIVIDGFRELTVELKRIGNNLNQLTRLVNSGKANCKDELAIIQKELDQVWQSLR